MSKDNRRTKYASVIQPNWAMTPVLEGRVVSVEDVKVDKRDVPQMLIEDADGLRYTVLESVSLHECFDAASPGDHIRIEFMGSKKTKAGRPFHQFAAQVWTEDADEVPAEATKTKARRSRRS